MAENDIKYVDEPLSEYEQYKNQHIQNVDNCFDEYTQRSGINIEENRLQSQKVYQLQRQVDDIEKRIRNLKNWKIFTIVMLCTSISVLILCSLIIGLSKTSEVNGGLIAGIVLSIVGIITTIGVLAGVISPRRKQVDSLYAQKRKEYEHEKAIAFQQVLPLVSLFKRGVLQKMFMQTMPFIKLYPNLTNQQIALMNKQFNISFDKVKTEENCVISLQSGSIYGNPFVFSRMLEHEMRTKTYTGTLTISWVSTSNNRSITHTQTLHASVTKPCPYYDEPTTLLFGTQAAPELKFERACQQINMLSEGQKKKLIKQTTKEYKKDTGITPLTNMEFESFWKVPVRNNEAQYRLLFTPLAQKNILSLLQDKTIGYGDEYDFVKDGTLAMIIAEHMQKMKFEENMDIYWTMFSYDNILNEFKSQAFNYFKDLYFSFALYFSIPIFQQTKTSDFIYEEWTNNKSNWLEYENNLTKVSNLFKHPDVKTPVILNVKPISTDASGDVVEVNSFGYDMIERVSYISVLGGDGRYHDVPVHWTEYILQKNQSAARVQTLNSFPIEQSYEQEVEQFWQSYKTLPLYSRSGADLDIDVDLGTRTNLDTKVKLDNEVMLNTDANIDNVSSADKKRTYFVKNAIITII
ncbi:hypothetical protein E1I18_02755 [Mycoplasmopsis mucosicanis]|uniref:Uncharacterized protein n=1 Tax=Mycoplasmopsis mucosicanis TaxID=458208 RepID=A0A507SKF2_9BACT|nr:hypothetical protein [Mycoplasmopsis mucosicanis]TQC51416.1 hypothetical protein E1I18_02755 [Mycoplasmopsis mucosicanis]